MKKISIFAMAFAAMLLLVSCGSAGSTTSSEASRSSENDAEIAIRVGSSTATAEELNSVVAGYCEMIGIDMSDETYADYINEMKYVVLNEYTNELVQSEMANELGFDQLSDEDVEACEKEIADFKASVSAYYSEQVRADEEFEGAADDVINAEVERQCQLYYEENGYTEDSMMKLVSQSKILENLYESQTADITVTDEDVKAEYDRLVAEDKSNYEADYSAFESVASYGDEQYYYAPEGFRMIKQIFIAFDDSADDEAAEATTESEADSAVTAEQKQAAKEKATAILEGLTAENFDSVMQEKSEDPGSAAYPDGYAVSPDASSTGYYEAFTKGAAALRNIGDISGLIESEEGYHILMYAGDIAAGAVDYATVRESLESDLLTTKQDEHFESLIEEWRSQMTVEQFPEAIGLTESDILTIEEAQEAADDAAVETGSIDESDIEIIEEDGETAEYAE